MAEQTAIVTTADVTARLSTQAYTRLFAKNGGSTVDTTFRDLCIAEANSMIRTITRAAFPDGLYTTTDTLDPGVIGKAVDIVCAIAASRHASYTEDGNYAILGREARAFFKAMNRDQDVRPPGASGVPAKPRASVTNVQTDGGVYTSSFTRAADLRDGTDF